MYVSLEDVTASPGIILIFSSDTHQCCQLVQEKQGSFLQVFLVCVFYKFIIPVDKSVG